jgi:hypothetical protein
MWELTDGTFGIQQIRQDKVQRMFLDGVTALVQIHMALLITEEICGNSTY